jgi:hypothetical protein
MPLAPPPPTNQDVSSRQFRDWFYSIYALIGKPGTTLGTMAYENANSVSITGGSIGGVGISGSTINNSTIGLSTPSSGAFTSALTRDGYTVKPNCYIEAYDRTATIAIGATPALLAPASTLSGSTGITYNSSTGIFTFAEEGDYTLSLSINAIASASNQFVYIYAENNTGSGWVANANSGKIYQLINNQITQIFYVNAVHRVAGQQVRYWIYSNSNKVQLQTQTLPTISSTVYVPAIRIQYS